MSGRKKILLIEDDRDLVPILQTMLSQQGFDVSFSYNGAKALKMARSVKPDLILLDIMLPDTDGYTLCLKLKEDRELSAVPIIVITALNRIDDQEKAIACGAADFIGKPFESARLLQKISKIFSPPAPQPS